MPEGVSEKKVSAMAIRFRKSIKIMPGVRINISKTGISTSLGPRGATVNLRRGRRKLTTGIPGTGFSQQHDITPQNQARRSSGTIWLIILVLLFIAWVLM
jgi:hypothetical protein